MWLPVSNPVNNVAIAALPEQCTLNEGSDKESKLIEAITAVLQRHRSGNNPNGISLYSNSVRSLHNRATIRRRVDMDRLERLFAQLNQITRPVQYKKL